MKTVGLIEGFKLQAVGKTKKSYVYKINKSKRLFTYEGYKEGKHIFKEFKPKNIMNRMMGE